MLLDCSSASVSWARAPHTRQCREAGCADPPARSRRRDESTGDVGARSALQRRAPTRRPSRDAGDRTGCRTACSCVPCSARLRQERLRVPGGAGPFPILFRPSLVICKRDSYQAAPVLHRNGRRVPRSAIAASARLCTLSLIVRLYLTWSGGAVRGRETLTRNGFVNSRRASTRQHGRRCETEKASGSCCIPWTQLHTLSPRSV